MEAARQHGSPRRSGRPPRSGARERTLGAVAPPAMSRRTVLRKLWLWMGGSPALDRLEQATEAIGRLETEASGAGHVLDRIEAIAAATRQPREYYATRLASIY